VAGYRPTPPAWGEGQWLSHHGVAACLHACWPRHAAMGRRGPLARGPYLFKLFSKSTQTMKFKTKIFPMSRNTQILQVNSLKIGNNFTFWTNIRIPQDCMLQILEQIQFSIFLNFEGVQTFLENLINSLKFHLYTLYLNMNLHWLTYIQILEVPLQVENVLSLFHTQKSWPLKYIVSTITSTPLYQIGQGVFYTELEVLCFHPVDMHTLSLKIEEGIEFPKVINAKQLPEKVWKLDN
jgi:hypothetical protein